MLKYKDFNYAVTRLTDSIVKYKEKPFKVLGPHDSLNETIYGFFLGSDEDIYPHFQEIDINPVHIGFVNGLGKHKQANYITRLPYRQWKQGLRDSNMFNLTTKNSTHGLTKSKTFIKSFKNIYPSIENCIEEIVCGETFSKAFHKEYCVRKVKNHLQLVRKDKVVGLVDAKFCDLILSEEFGYLEDEIKEIV